MNLLDMKGQVFSATKAKEVASQLQESECEGWRYDPELAFGFGRVKVTDDEGNFVGYF